MEDHLGFGLSTDFAMRYWRSKGAAPEKLLLGMGAYGRGFNLVNPSNNGLYAPASSGIDAAMYTSAAGFWGYNEYCEKMLNEQSQWTLVRVNMSFAVLLEKAACSMFLVLFIFDVKNEESTRVLLMEQKRLLRDTN